MAISGKSLVGFMERDFGLHYLRNVCAYEDCSTARLQHEWERARQKIGRPMNRYGQPEILDMPDDMRVHVERLKEAKWLKHRLADDLEGASFSLVEIDPLLAMQFAVNTSRSEDLCKDIGNPPQVRDLLRICLPFDKPQQDVSFDASSEKKSMLVSTKNLSLKVVAEGAREIGPDGSVEIHVGIQLDFPLPLLHVVRYNGRCYLHNGFHRAYGMRLAGATHIPCMMREVSHPDDIGISRLETFSLDLLQSDNPPTVGHFVHGRAHDVPMKSLTRVLQVSWAEFTVDGF